MLDIEPVPEMTHGIFAEVVANDSYALASCKQAPNMIWDIGANVGIFTMYARHLYPAAHIVSLEPHPGNVSVLSGMVAHHPRVQVLRGALGRGPMYYRMGEGISHSHHAYYSGCYAYPVDEVEVERVDVPVYDLCWLEAMFPATPRMVKMDCEGGELFLLEDVKSTDVLRRSDFVTCELHAYSIIEDRIPEVWSRLRAWIDGFRTTHDVQVKLLGKNGFRVSMQRC